MALHRGSILNSLLVGLPHVCLQHSGLPCFAGSWMFSPFLLRKPVSWTLVTLPTLVTSALASWVPFAGVRFLGQRARMFYGSGNCSMPPPLLPLSLPRRLPPCSPWVVHLLFSLEGPCGLWLCPWALREDRCPCLSVPGERFHKLPCKTLSIECMVRSSCTECCGLCTGCLALEQAATLSLHLLGGVGGEGWSLTISSHFRTSGHIVQI